MAFENAQTIPELNPLFPLGSDPVGQGDDHIRSVKKVLTDFYDINYIATIRRAYIDSGYPLVDGSFRLGGVLPSANSALLDEDTGIGYSGAGPFPQTVAPLTDPLSGGFVARHLASLRTDLSGDSGGSNIFYTPTMISGLVKRAIDSKLNNLQHITDLAAVSGVASADVDARVIAAVAADCTIVFPAGFHYKTAGTLNMPSLKPVRFVCYDGRATMSASVAGLMFGSINQFKFQGSFFKGIDFVGFDKQNAASQWMFAPEGTYVANFFTEDCSWDGFHTVIKASCIAVKHYRPVYRGCGDTGAIVDSYHWTTSLFSSFNLNEWHEPTFIGKFGRLFKILGGYNNRILTPWFEKVETVAAEMILLRQHFLFVIEGVGWLENFKSRFLFNLDGDGTENTQSDMCIIDGLHLNNNWSIQPDHPGVPSGFEALFNRLNPQFVGNNQDTKFIFRNIVEHPDSVVGWALTRTGSTLNLDSSIHEFVGCKLRPGQPNTSGGMVLGGSNPDLRRYFRDLSSNKLDLIPSNFQIISGRNTTGSQKDLVFDNSGDATYFRRNAVKLLEWTTNYFAPGTANTMLCGVASRPWSGGNTQVAFTTTSDIRWKDRIRTLLNSEDIEVQEEVQRLIAAYKELDLVMYCLIAEAEDTHHFGILAQRAIEVFSRHGLDWTKYSIFKHDTWPATPALFDEDGTLIQEAEEGGDKYSINYEELLILGDLVHRHDVRLQSEVNQALLQRIDSFEMRLKSAGL